MLYLWYNKVIHMDRKEYTSVVIPKKLMALVEKSVEDKKLWISSAEFVRDAIKNKINSLHDAPVV